MFHYLVDEILYFSGTYSDGNNMFQETDLIYKLSIKV
jgi:hypothetical protein